MRRRWQQQVKPEHRRHGPAGTFQTIASGILCLTVLTLPACGRKTAVKPPQFVAPESIKKITATNQEDGIRLTWERPQLHADGSAMRDLAGFHLERSRGNGARQLIATLPVTDRDRFRQIKRFRYVDTNVTAGERYRYRVFAFTLDGDVGTPGGEIEIVRSPQTDTDSLAPEKGQVEH